jgi:O-antigen ligase
VNNSPSRFFQFVARLFFALTILLMPFRFRLVLWERPFFPIYSDYTDFLFYASDFALLFMLTFWAAYLIIEPRKVSVGNKFLWVLLVGLTLSGWLSALGSVDPVITQYHAVRFTGLLFFYLYIVNEVSSVIGVVIPVGLQGLLQAPVALGQSLLQSSLGLQAFGEHVLDPQVLGTSIIPIASGRFLRAYGLTDHPNILGGCLAFVLVILWTTVMTGKSKGRIALAAIAFVFMFPALLLTFSRSAWVGLFVAVGFLLMSTVYLKDWRALKLSFLVGVFSLTASLPFLIGHFSVFNQRINSGNVAEDQPMNERTYLLNAGNTLFVEHSAIGVGLGASPLAMKLRFENFRVNFQPPHFTPLLSALETGVVGGIFYFLLSMVPFILFLLRWRKYMLHPPVLGTIALLFAITMVNLFDYYTWMYAPGRLWQWLAWGLYSMALEKAG